MRKVFLFTAAVCLLAVAWPSRSQEVYKKKEIAVFNLSYYQWDIPQELLGSLDERIRSVFVNLGRFTVIGMTYRLEESDISVFIEKIRAFKEENVEIPEQVQMGKEFFTQADLNRLVSSFIVVIPVVSRYDVALDKRGYSVVNLSTSFTCVNVETAETIAQFTVNTTGTSLRREDAIKSAVSSIPSSLTFEIRKVPEFQIKTGVLEVNGDEVVFELGKDTGITVGDEYEILATRVLPSGKQVTESKGLLLVKRVEEEVSYATVLFADQTPALGDQLREVPRLGAETAAYARWIFTEAPAGTAPMTMGLRQVLTRGFYDLRPAVELEFPLIAAVISHSIPLNAALGGEYVLHLGRLELIPRISGGVGFNVDFPSGENPRFQVSRFGGSAGVAATWMVTRDIKLAGEAGYTYWYSLNQTAFGPTYGGVFAEAAVSFRY